MCQCPCHVVWDAQVLRWLSQDNHSRGLLQLASNPSRASHRQGHRLRKDALTGHHCSKVQTTVHHPRSLSDGHRSRSLDDADLLLGRENRRPEPEWNRESLLCDVDILVWLLHLLLGVGLSPDSLQSVWQLQGRKTLARDRDYFHEDFAGLRSVQIQWADGVRDLPGRLQKGGHGDSPALRPSPLLPHSLYSGVECQAADLPPVQGRVQLEINQGLQCQVVSQDWRVEGKRRTSISRWVGEKRKKFLSYGW